MFFSGIELPLPVKDEPQVGVCFRIIRRHRQRLPEMLRSFVQLPALDQREAEIVVCDRCGGVARQDFRPQSYGVSPGSDLLLGDAKQAGERQADEQRHDTPAGGVQLTERFREREEEADRGEVHMVIGDEAVLIEAEWAQPKDWEQQADEVSDAPPDAPVQRPGADRRRQR